MAAQEVLVPHLRPLVTTSNSTVAHVENCWWFHQEATRNAIHRLLGGQPQGAFAVRGSISYPGSFVLTASIDASRAMIYEWLLERTDAGFHVQNSNLYLPSIPELVAYLCSPAGVEIMGIKLRPDLWPEAGEVIRPVLLPPPQTQVDVTRDVDVVQESQVHTWTEEKIDRQLVFDIVPVVDDDLGLAEESFRTLQGGNDMYTTRDVSLGALRQGYAGSDDSDSSTHEHREHTHTHYTVRQVR
eukprot:m.29671 g.29671  ORF g.29671 m.29671 type:complete len:242 (-) comp11965_c0_seq1:74-799(-)